jgi:hypothetical protein
LVERGSLNRGQLSRPRAAGGTTGGRYIAHCAGPNSPTRAQRATSLDGQRVDRDVHLCAASLLLRAMIVETGARLATKTDRTCGASLSEPSWCVADSRREMEQATVRRLPKH